MANYVPPPPASHNGGLYAGEPFEKDAPWRNFPVTPDAGFFNFTNLPNAPLIAQHHVPGGGLRPGNNTPLLPSNFAHSRVASINAVCIPVASKSATTNKPLNGDETRGFSSRGFAYLSSMTE